MPLQSSGPISLANLQTEFGGANPISISEYYRGGGLVSAGASSSIPTSGAISLSNFYGGSGVPSGTVLLTSTSKTVNNEVHPSQGSSQSGFALGAQGKLYAFANQFAPNWFEITPTNEWYEPESEVGAAQFECRATTWPGDVISATDLDYPVNVTAWTRLGGAGSGGRGARYWWIDNAQSGSVMSATFTIEIRQVGTSTILASQSITLTARLFDGDIQ